MEEEKQGFVNIIVVQYNPAILYEGEISITIPDLTGRSSTTYLYTFRINDLNDLARFRFSLVKHSQKNTELVARLRHPDQIGAIEEFKEYDIGTQMIVNMTFNTIFKMCIELWEEHLTIDRLQKIVRWLERNILKRYCANPFNGEFSPTNYQYAHIYNSCNSQAP